MKKLLVSIVTTMFFAGCSDIPSIPNLEQSLTAEQKFVSSAFLEEWTYIHGGESVDQYCTWLEDNSVMFNSKKDCEDDTTIKTKYNVVNDTLENYKNIIADRPSNEDNHLLTDIKLELSFAEDRFAYTTIGGRVTITGVQIYKNKIYSDGRETESNKSLNLYYNTIVQNEKYKLESGGIVIF